MKPLSGLRILICGKGGSGKSSVVSIMANALQDKGYKVLLLDGDASNPGGLLRLSFGLESRQPKPLIEFFGGREKVECPVDDPSPLTRKEESIAVVDKHIDLDEIPFEYFARRKNITLFQVGKIQNPFEGCDGPMSKVTRDFIVKGDHVMLIDMEAGIEHFGRGIEQNVDIVLLVVDPTFESIAIADRVTKLCKEMKIEQVWSLLNAVQSAETKSKLNNELAARQINVLGTVKYDSDVARAGLEGSIIVSYKAKINLAKAINRLEIMVSKQEVNK